MTYESPITLITTQTDNYIKEINEKTDEVIFKAVVNVLPQVNKEELIKALAYDREQYSKGYKDRDSEIVRCKDCIHAEHRCQMEKQVYCFRDKLSVHGYLRDDDDFCKYGERNNHEQQKEGE